MNSEPLATRMPDVDAATKPDGDDPEAKQAILRAHVAQLAEHFQYVQVFAANHVSEEEGTTTHQYGSGTMFARQQIVKDWCIKHDEFTRLRAKAEFEE